MIIACPRCGASYAVEDERFGTRARTVECSACGERWLKLPAPGLTAEQPAGSATTSAGGNRPMPSPVEIQPAKPDEAPEAPDVEQPTSTQARRELPSRADQTVTDAPAAEAASEAMPVAGPASDPAPVDAPEQHGGDGEPAGNAPSAADSRSPKPARSLRALLSSRAMVAAIAGLATVCALSALGLALRGPIVAMLPAAAGVYGAVGLAPDPLGDGLEIRDVASERGRQGGEDVLMVRGIVANVATDTMALPPLRVSLWNANNEEVQFVTFNPDADRLAPGETLQFETSITEPRPEARVLRVGFVAPDL